MEEITFNNYIITLDNAENLLYINVLSELTFKQYNIELITEDLFEINNRLFNTNILFNVLLDGLNKTNENITINIKETIDKLVINVIYEQQYDPYEFSISIATLQEENANLDRVLCEYNSQKKTITELQIQLFDLQMEFNSLINDLSTKNIFNRLGDDFCIVPSIDNLIRMNQTSLVSWGNKAYVDGYRNTVCTYDIDNRLLKGTTPTSQEGGGHEITIYKSYIIYKNTKIKYFHYENNCYLSLYNENDLQFINSMKNINTIVLAGNLIITNLSFLADCTTLEHLTLDECYNLCDISVLEKLINLKTISLLGCAQLNDIGMLVSMDNLETLDIRRTSIDSTMCLNHLTKLVIKS